jgi:uncharacterized damage-inducible protein DinB
VLTCTAGVRIPALISLVLRSNAGRGLIMDMITNAQSQPVGSAFVASAISHLQEDFLPKIRKCVELLSEEDVWWHESEAENSVGNLLLHLSGNVRQWIISGLGNEPDSRDRPAEFAARGGKSRWETFALLDSTVQEACRVLNHLTEEDLLKERTIQCYRRTGLQAIFHVVEHFSYHTGQIVFVTKLRRHQDLRFYNL